MQKKVILPQDELAHPGQAIEWWYFNGFLEGKNTKKSFMTCLFKADKDKINLSFLKVPMKTIYFSHTLIYDLKTKKVEKEVLPIVSLSADSFTYPELFINYAYLLRKDLHIYEISRKKEELRIKTRFFDLTAKESKDPLLEGGNGYIDLGPKSTYYYSYPRLQVEGTLKGVPVSGIAWHDKQWSKQGFMKDNWLWFSLQLGDGTDIVCFDYKGTKMATISYKNNKQETVPVEFTPLGEAWISPETKIPYNLSWQIKVKDKFIITKPLINECEMNFGFLNYWEGPLEIRCNGERAHGFMELLAHQKPQSITNALATIEKGALRALKLWNPKK